MVEEEFVSAAPGKPFAMGVGRDIAELGTVVMAFSEPQWALWGTWGGQGELVMVVASEVGSGRW